jgi:acyl carrier protein
LGLKTAEVDTSLGLFEMGMDSLMSVELKRRLEKRSMKQLPSTLTFNYPNIGALAGYLLKLIAPELPVAETVANPGPVSRDQREDLSESELADLLAKALGATV